MACSSRNHTDTVLAYKQVAAAAGCLFLYVRGRGRYLSQEGKVHVAAAWCLTLACLLPAARRRTPSTWPASRMQLAREQAGRMQAKPPGKSRGAVMGWRGLMLPALIW